MDFNDDRLFGLIQRSRRCTGCPLHICHKMRRLLYPLRFVLSVNIQLQLNLFVVTVMSCTAKQLYRMMACAATHVQAYSMQTTKLDHFGPHYIRKYNSSSGN